MRLLTCGCARCGCACEQHAPSRRQTPCAHHAPTSTPKWLIQELGTIIARGLHRRGWTDEEIKAWLQSKNPRWALDGELGDLITSIGEIYSRGLEKMPAQ